MNAIRFPSHRWVMLAGAAAAVALTAGPSLAGHPYQSYGGGYVIQVTPQSLPSRTWTPQPCPERSTVLIVQPVPWRHDARRRSGPFGSTCSPRGTHWSPQLRFAPPSQPFCRTGSFTSLSYDGGSISLRIVIR